MAQTLQVSRIAARIAEALPLFLDELRLLVELDSGTFNKAGNDHVGGILAGWYQALGADIERFAQPEIGDSRLVTFRSSGRGRVLLLGHTDTVYPDGTAAERPFRVVGDRAFGPGTADMKAGDLAIVHAVRALFAEGWGSFERIEILHNSDEEIGSPASRQLIAERALAADAVLVLEAGRENGNVVSARKGIADFRLEVRGRSAHAGVNHDRGRSAVLELAHLIVALEALNHTIPGVTLNVGQVSGGSRPNVVPDHADARLEVRAAERRHLEAAIAQIESVVAQRTVEGTEITLHTSVNHYPMHKTDDAQKLVDHARALALELGFFVNDTATGGASDGNTAAGVGRPVLDGLGPIGGGAHSPDEYIVISSVPARVAMLAGLVAAICGDVAAEPDHFGRL